MQHFWEIIFGLDKGFLGRNGHLRLNFNPQWPGQDVLHNAIGIGAGLWNIALAIGIILLVLYVYRREGRSRPARLILGAMRLLLLGLILLLLNRPVLTLGQTRDDPSILAIVMDKSISMSVPDVPAPDGKTESRLAAVQNLLDADNQALVRNLAKIHTLRFYTFDGGEAHELTSVIQTPQSGDSPQTLLQTAGPPLTTALSDLKPDGRQTHIVTAVRSVLDQLQGRRLAGVILLTDGRETPTRSANDAIAALKDYNVKIYPIAIGSDQAPKNIALESINVEDTAFNGDIVLIKATLRATGYGPNHPVHLRVLDAQTHLPLLDPAGRPVQRTIDAPDNKPVEVELRWKPDAVGDKSLLVEAQNQPGEIDEQDNIRPARVSVLDAQINVLYVDGYPRWDYRYLKNEMIRDKTVNISCILTSADPSFAQEADHPRGTRYFPYKVFPETMEQLMESDVVIFGDVDPRQFSDRQLQMVANFVSDKGGGFGMVAGPRWSPQSYRNTPIEALLPVNISHVTGGEDESNSITAGFRPELTKVGRESSIFRFFTDEAQNEKFLKQEIQPLFWYCRGATVKPGVGEVYAEHPTDIGPDGRKAPLLVLGRFGAGRTLFSAIDDSWRWRFYTGESIFDNYWIQQLRYLARGRKLGQRRVAFTSLRPAYQLGEQVRINMRVLDPVLLTKLPDSYRVEITDAQGQPVRQATLLRSQSQSDLYTASFPADRVGSFIATAPRIAGDIEPAQLRIPVIVPRLELASPQVDRTLLSRLASETDGQIIPLADAASRLPGLIPSAARITPIDISQPLWDAPLAMIIFVLLITSEWVARKIYGML